MDGPASPAPADVALSLQPADTPVAAHAEEAEPPEPAASGEAGGRYETVENASARYAASSGPGPEHERQQRARVEAGLSPEAPTPGAGAAASPGDAAGAGAALALGTWSIVFEALGLAAEEDTLPYDHLLHPGRVSGSIEGWAASVALVQSTLAKAVVDRQTLTHAQYRTREGRLHLLQQAVMRTAKHANLNPGDWEPFSKTLDDWLGSVRGSVAEVLLPHVDILLPRTSSPRAGFSPSAIFTPSAAGSVRNAPTKRAALTPRNLTPEEAQRMGLAKLQAEVLMLREWKAKREAADKAEDGAIVLDSLKKRLVQMQNEASTYPTELRQALGKDEVLWRDEQVNSAEAARVQVLASHATGHTQQTKEQAELLQHMTDYVDKIVSDVPDGKLQIEVEEHERLVGTLNTRRQDMIEEHAQAKKNLAESQRQDVEQLQREELAAQEALAERIVAAREDTEQTLQEFAAKNVCEIAALKGDIASLLETVNGLRCVLD